jgi:hypothetical protein
VYDQGALVSRYRHASSCFAIIQQDKPDQDEGDGPEPGRHLADPAVETQFQPARPAGGYPA